MVESKMIDELFNILLKLARENINENDLKEKTKEKLISILKEYIREYAQIQG